MCIICLMNNILDKVTPFLALGMLTIFALFVVVGALFGMGRGVKRAGLRFVIFGGLLLVAFFITPLIVNGTLNANFKISGYTPQEFVQYCSDRLIEFLQQNMGDYVVPFQDYIKDYALGIVLALLNLVVFYGLYFVVKFVGWAIYAVAAHFMAPKQTKEGKKLPKHAGWGALVGALQGVFLFVIFLFPINGLVGVVNHVGEYASQQAANEQHVQTQSIAIDGDSISESFNSIDKSQVTELMKKMDGPLKGYNNFIKFSGIQFLSDKALEYQMTIRVENAEDINLMHDLNNGLELVVDAQDVMKVMNKFQHASQSGKIDLSGITQKDYQVLRNFINKAFEIQVLNVANQVLGDMDQIFRTPFNDNINLLPGTEIYENSIYGLLIKNNTTTRNMSATLAAGETNYTKYAQGLEAAVQYIGNQKLDLVRKDLINMIDFMEALNIYKVSYNGLAEEDTMASLLAQGGLGAKDYLDLSTAKLTNTYGKYQAGEYLIYVLGNRLMQFSTVQLVGLKNVDYLLTYGKVMDDKFNNDRDLKNLVDDLIPMFVGENALTHYDEHNQRIQGNWETLGKDVVEAAHVLRDYVTIADDIKREKTTLLANGTNPSRAQVQAVLNYMEKLVITQQEYDLTKDTNPDFIGKSYDEIKYQKIDQLVDVLYTLMDDFPPLKNFMRDKLQGMANADGGEYIQMLLDMLDKPKEDWQDTLQNIVNVVNIINHSNLGKLIDKVQTDPAGFAEDLINSVAELSQQDVEDMINSVLDVPGIGNTVQASLDKAMKDLDNISDDQLQDMLVGGGNTMTPEQITAVRDKADAVQGALDTLNSAGYEHMSEAEKEAAEKALADNLGALWGELQNYKIPGVNA